MANNNAGSNNKPQGYNDSSRVKGSVDGASKMKPVIGNRKPAGTDKKK
ncbi:hypothetical protein [Vibrio parahaemolyticus]|nr:hypothetical protein [Vibrio parahaemolyticus]MCZ5989855.1 hypothetical protein [Vibrio parahaemolyticus]MDF4866479.1 hypothetical protein [Vibrio parahaemolyticus]MDG2642121.1 hypothetical protein [Vibrio parahaemolyticus]MDG2809847.1 hypothetical protein [Vibrio parahaemolyticus]MDG3418702.1 hypothetical protein [Vibrio parahaemolyticus]